MKRNSALKKNFRRSIQYILLYDLLYTYVVSKQYKDAVLFLMETGTRIGELSRLTVSFYDFDDRQVVIKCQLVRDEYGIICIVPTETEA